jgi:replication fork protection complex subunit Csm3/Swi3
MLNMYQLWLDDLYPRAKFADALTIIEKVGHTKRMQMMRKEWIDAGKPRRTTEREDEEADEVVPDHAPTEDRMEGLERDGSTRQQEPGAERDSLGQTREQRTSHTADADPDEDELDALIAESEQLDNSASKALPTRTNATEEDPFADEMEAMADMDDMW